MAPKLLRPKEVADVLGVHVYTVYDLLKSGRLEGFKLRTHWRIKPAALERFMQSNGKDNIEED